MKYFFIILVFLATILPGCEFLLDYDFVDSKIVTEDMAIEPKLCVYARYYVDKGLNMQIHRTGSILNPWYKNDGVHDLSEAKVRLTKSGGETCLDTIINLSTSNKVVIGTDKFSIVPQNGDSLAIFVEAAGFDAVHGKTIVPLPVPIDTVLVKKYYSDKKMYRFILFFTDPETDNFYYVSSVYNLITYENPIYDTTYYKTRIPVSLTDPVFDFLPDFRTSIKEPFNISDRKPRVFSDEGINNSKYGLNIEVPVNEKYLSYGPFKYVSSTYELELYSVSKEIFEAYKSTYLYEIIDGDIYAEPVYVYSNMSNKVGFFGAYGKKFTSLVKIDNWDVLYYNDQVADWYL